MAILLLNEPLKNALAPQKDLLSSYSSLWSAQDTPTSRSAVLMLPKGFGFRLGDGFKSQPCHLLSVWRQENHFDIDFTFNYLHIRYFVYETEFGEYEKNSKFPSVLKDAISSVL